MTVGELVRRAREARGWTQTDLARETGLRQTYISQVEGGEIALPRTGNGANVNLLTGLMRCACGGTVVYSSVRQRATGERYLECRNFSKARPRGRDCPIRGKRTAPYYEELVAAEFLALPELIEEPEDSTVAEARVRIAERRRIIEDLYIESRDRATYDTRRAALDAEEAALPVPMPLGAALIAAIAQGQALWRAGELTTREANSILRSVFSRVIISGPSVEIVPVPLLARLLASRRGGARVAGTG